ncbi:epoxide hydrolase A-like [Phoenix dactylifera]|uniref:soluble epoxide hydrolase n=1 Tax=Phoenix dactylifera TaxID=42345 RepID=A0A8B7CVE2_PHODC|nr:epoxide hydrolase A-like [Phoenix dactylifera]
MLYYREEGRQSPQREREMEGASGISHRTVEVNGIRMHVVEKGEGPAVLLLHGFPELWYSWRHQIAGLAARGYRAIAPDLRGYGDTDAPPDVASYSALHIVGDLVALLDALALPHVFVVGHDWGALIAWYLCMFRPDKVKALVNLSVAFMPRNPAMKTVDYFRKLYGDDYYICRFQEPGAIEARFAQIGTASIFKTLLQSRDPGPFLIPKEGWDLPEKSPLCSWLSEEDINYYASKFDKSGFTGPVNYYRCMNLNWELTAPWTGVQIKVPAKFIVGDLDLTYHYPGIQDYIHNGGFKQNVPLLQEVVVMEGVGHFINQEKGHEITDHIYDFIQKF